jgi:hypothetical protein
MVCACSVDLPPKMCAMAQTKNVQVVVIVLAVRRVRKKRRGRRGVLIYNSAHMDTHRADELGK